MDLKTHVGISTPPGGGYIIKAVNRFSAASDQKDALRPYSLAPPRCSPPTLARVYVAESAGEIVAFGACGGQRDVAMRERGFAGEIGAVYVLRSQQGGGVGRALMSLLARNLMARLMSGASLWVLRENVGARGFYEGLGGAIIIEKDAVEGNTTSHEVAYGWPDLAHLI